MISIFISYARKDGRELALNLQQTLEPEFGVWLDTSDIAKGASWSAEIEQAIDDCDVMLALLSTGSYVSEICRGEHLRALRLGKKVIPLLVQPDADRPIYLEGANYQDFSQASAFNQALESLKTEITTGKAIELAADFKTTTIHITEQLPVNFVERPDALDRLRDLVLSDSTDRQVALTALRGMGGIGKSVLAIALCYDQAIQDAFPDGIVWVKIGRENVNLVDKIQAIATAFDDDMSHYGNLDAARVALSKLLADKAALIVLDDIWETEHLRPFLINAPRCRTLFTTRDEEIALAVKATQYDLGMLTPAQALQLLTDWAEHEDADFAKIAKRLGYLPLALQLVGAQFKADPRLTANDWLETFDNVSKIRLGRRSKSPTDNLKVCLDLSLERLEVDDRPLYHSLGVFPEDIWIPEAVVIRLWRHLDPDLSATDCRELITDLSRLSLLDRDENHDHISLHDLLHIYNREILDDKYAINQYDLLMAYNPNIVGWHTIPNDDYLYDYIAYHLIQAGKTDILSELLLDFKWLQAKLDATDSNAILNDFTSLLAAISEANNSTSKKDVLELVQDAIKISSDFIDYDPSQLAGHLVGRLGSYTSEYPLIDDFLKDSKAYDDEPALVLVHPSLEPVGGALINTIPLVDGASKLIPLIEDDYILVASYGYLYFLKLSELRIDNEKTIYAETIIDVACFENYIIYVTEKKHKFKVHILNWKTNEIICDFFAKSNIDRELIFESETHILLFEDKLFLSISSEPIIEIWNYKTGTFIKILDTKLNYIEKLKFNDSGELLIYYGKTIYAIDWKNHLSAPLIVFSEKPNSKQYENNDKKLLQVLQDGNLLYTDGYYLYIEDIKSKKILRKFDVTMNYISSIAVWKNIVITACFDDIDLKIWDWTKEQRQVYDKHNETVWSVGTYRQYACTYSDIEFKLWNILDYTVLYTHEFDDPFQITRAPQIILSNNYIFIIHTRYDLNPTKWKLNVHDLMSGKRLTQLSFDDQKRIIVTSEQEKTIVETFLSVLEQQQTKLSNTKIEFKDDYKNQISAYSKSDGLELAAFNFDNPIFSLQYNLENDLLIVGTDNGHVHVLKLVGLD